ncbi:MAG: MFS transporter [Alphaproteobacteria bacterium]|nr:MFS transporter [Alphaproteobacteria bacterium]
MSVDSPQGTLLAQRPLLFFLASRASSRFASQIGAVAIGWQIYDLTHSAAMLGLVGLVQFLPTLLLVFVAGHAADRFERKRVMQLCQLAEVAMALFLALACWTGAIGELEIFAATFVLGMAGAFESPATAALLPLVVERSLLQRASALSSGVAEFATIAGPALGGLAYAMAPSLAYGAMALLWLSGMVFTGLVRAGPQDVALREAGDDVFAGVRFIRSHPIILGTISLDLFAVLFGGVTALLPIYARDILATGPAGLGVLRAAPAAGALAMTVVLARRAITARLGMRMFQAVIAFGIATVLFACSRWLWLSLVALAFLGAADTVSVVIRYSLVQLSTPDAMRGRVGAVNFLFINASNQLGQFESGITAALFGTVPAALLGGVATILVAGVWMRLFPALVRVERLE